MLIDFHTHIFPDAIAEKSINTLKGHIIETRNCVPEVFHDGTLNGLLKEMDEDGVDKSVVLPIATSEKQTENINNFAEQIRSERIESFGSLHPAQKNYKEVLTKLKERGFIGIKLHHNYQGVDLDSEESIRVIKKAEELGLYVTFHAGIDMGMKGHVFATPKMLVNVLKHVEGSRIIAAHMGGFEMWEDVLEMVCGTPVLLDTAICGKCMPRDCFRRVIDRHGANKVLFATDSPWERPAQTLEALESLGLSAEELDLIKYKNAEAILRRSLY